MGDRHLRASALWTLFAGAPAVVVAVVLLWTRPLDPALRYTLAFVVVAAWLAGTSLARARIVAPMRMLSSMLAGLREGDFSVRARGASERDAVGLALAEANALGETLRSERLGAVEAGELVRHIMRLLDVAILAFDDDDRLVLLNPAAERLVGRRSSQLLERSAEELGLGDWLTGEAQRTLDVRLAGGAGRWDMRRTPFRRDGRAHTLLLLTDMRRALREEERLAWRRLIRVLSHEINNSLAPIQSLSGSLRAMLDAPVRDDEWDEDLAGGLDVIAGRADGLRRFMSSYADLARLPPPAPREVSVGDWIDRVVAIDGHAGVVVERGPDVTLRADPDQLEQMLINLVKNARDAVAEVGGGHGGVTLGWSRSRDMLKVWVLDEGPGLSDSANLFVPFYSTKPGGSGVGLVLSQQIAEAHGGSLRLGNRSDRTGCVAVVRLPLGTPRMPGDDDDGEENDDF